MPHVYDASTKYLIETRLADWLPLCGQTTTAPIQVVDADLATITSSADRVLRICESPPWLMHVEPQASRDPMFVPNLPVYNVVLERRHGVRVRTVVVLLRRVADAPEFTGTLERGFSGEPLVAQLLEGVRGMKGSVTYQAIAEEGVAKGIVKGEVRAKQEVLLQLGERRFGAVSTSTEQTLRGIADSDRLARLIGALLDVSSWEELLATP